MNKYMKKIGTGEGDVYDVLVAFGITCPAVAHAVKKLLMPGKRGHKTHVQDLAEAKQSIERAIQLAGTPDIGDGWVEWKGGECPVHPDHVVDVRYRGPITHPLDRYPGDGKRAGDLRWWYITRDDMNAIYDIVAYRDSHEAWKRSQEEAIEQSITRWGVIELGALSHRNALSTISAFRNFAEALNRLRAQPSPQEKPEIADQPVTRREI